MDINNTIFEPEQRIEYYLGNLNHLIYVPTRHMNSKIIIVDEGFKYSDNIMKNYFEEMCNYYEMFKRVKMEKFKFLFVPGDVQNAYDVPVLCKSRPCKPSYNILLPFNIPRHWLPIKDVHKYDIPFDKKKSVCVWRGSTTGKHRRLSLVYNYHDSGKNIDIGFTNYTNDYVGVKSPKFIKNRMTMKDMLQCKYIISIEGNDVASNLKWILSSQSICIKPPATMASWLMEDRLIPWIHYVPVKHDFSDLIQKVQWCENHPSKCKQIVKNANDYMSRFKNDKNEEHIILNILNIYYNRVKFV